MASPSSPEVIDVDVDEPPRITGGTGKPDAPLEIASSDSEDENPAKRAKPAPVTPLSPAGPPSPFGNADLAQLAREREEREAKRGPPRPAPAPAAPPPPRPEVIQDAEGVRGLVVVKNFWGRAQCATALAAIDSGVHAFEGGWRRQSPGRSSMHFGPLGLSQRT